MSLLRHGRTLLLTAIAAVVLVLVALSPSFGRAVPSGSYRPPLPEDALTNGCWPLPGGARLDFGYQVRTDTVALTPVGLRRVLVLHFDEIGLDRARDRVRRAFADVGRPRAVRVRGQAFTGLGDEDVVRGQLVLWLPPSQPRTDRPECTEVFSTKGFGTVPGGA